MTSKRIPVPSAQGPDPGDVSPNMMPVTMGLLAAVMGIVSSSHVSAQCPSNFMTCNSSTITSTAPADSTACGYSGYFDGTVKYNLVAGRFDVGAYGSHLGSDGSVAAFDVYRVIGPAVGTPVAFLAELRVQAYADASSSCIHASTFGSITASLGDGEGNLVSVERHAQCFTQPCECSGSGSLDSVLVIPIQRVTGAANEEFQLEFRLSASGRDGYGHVRADLTFSGLPAGAHIVSCQGFRQDFPVPALPVSWGAIKSRYR